MIKTTLTDAQLIEKDFRKQLNLKIELGLDLETQSDWMIEQIEVLLNCYPMLRQFNYKKMGLKELQALIQRLFEYLDMQYTEQDELILVDLRAESTGLQTLMSLKEMILWFILAMLKDKSHVHFTFDEKLLDKIKVSEAHAIDYFCDNSYFIRKVSKKECYFTLSVAAVLSCDYYHQDPIIQALVPIQQEYKKDLTVSEYIDYRKAGQNINTKPKLKIQSSSIKISL